MIPPAPMSEAPPPVAGANTFIVFFDWNRSWVTPVGMEILRQAADVYRHGGIVAVHVTGYTDTSGSYRYNERLSRRRAWHVASVLERLGVPRQAMSVVGRGENDLRVPTPPGVREAQNRRVEVIEN
jgi:outer membrane protein OmpA-like peptidoglycan-associated protein